MNFRACFLLNYEYIVYKEFVPHKEHCASITNVNLWMQDMEIMVVKQPLFP
jgi:hypothetical protein